MQSPKVSSSLIYSVTLRFSFHATYYAVLLHKMLSVFSLEPGEVTGGLPSHWGQTAALSCRSLKVMYPEATLWIVNRFSPIGFPSSHIVHWNWFDTIYSGEGLERVWRVFWPPLRLPNSAVYYIINVCGVTGAIQWFSPSPALSLDQDCIHPSQHTGSLKCTAPQGQLSKV